MQTKKGCKWACLGFAAFAALIAILVTINLKVCQKRDYREVFFNNWAIMLPENMKEEFRKSEDSWYGDGIRYAVFKLEQEPTEFLSDFSNEKSAEIEAGVCKFLLEAKFRIPKKHLPDFDNDYLYKHIQREYYNSYDHCYMLYFPSSLKLAVCQYFA